MLGCYVTKKTDSDKDKDNESNSNENNNDNNNYSNEPELIAPDCTGVVGKPYDIQVYSDSKLKSNIK